MVEVLFAVFWAVTSSTQLVALGSHDALAASALLEMVPVALSST